MSFFAKNPLLKIISLLLAVVLWAFVKGRSGTEVSLTVPLELEAVPANLVVTHVSDESINVRLVGPISQLSRLSEQHVRAKLDLSQAKAGVNTFELRSRDLTLAKGVKVIQMSPSSVRVELDRVTERVVAVKAQVRGEPAPGYRIGSVFVNPPFVSVVGGRSQLAVISDLKTEEIDITGARSTVVVDAPLKIEGVRVKDNKKTVQVTVNIKRVGKEG